MKKPLRMEMCLLLTDGKARTTEDFFIEMKDSYLGEKQIFNIEEHLQSLRAVGIIAVQKEWVETHNGEEKLIQSWILSRAGKERLANFL